MQTVHQLLSHALQENGHHLDPETINKLVKYLELMQTWNKVYNLTTITNPRDMVYLHIIDSLAIQPYLHGTRMLDVGSGAGLPGLPLAIINPQQHWVLLDKNNKKTRFMTQAIAELKLSNVEAAHHRCEDFQPELCFDSILSRAFGTLGLFVETTEHLLCDNGIFIAMKGKYPQDELVDIPKHFGIQTVASLKIKGMDIERHVVCLKRI